MLKGPRSASEDVDDLCSSSDEEDHFTVREMIVQLPEEHQALLEALRVSHAISQQVLKLLSAFAIYVHIQPIWHTSSQLVSTYMGVCPNEIITIHINCSLQKSW